MAAPAEALHSGPAGVEVAWIRYSSRVGTNWAARIEGTSSVHDWLVEGKIIGGFMVPGMPTVISTGNEVRLSFEWRAVAPKKS